MFERVCLAKRANGCQQPGGGARRLGTDVASFEHDHFKTAFPEKIGDGTANHTAAYYEDISRSLHRDFLLVTYFTGRVSRAQRVFQGEPTRGHFPARAAKNQQGGRCNRYLPAKNFVFPRQTRWQPGAEEHRWRANFIFILLARLYITECTLASKTTDEDKNGGSCFLLAFHISARVRPPGTRLRAIYACGR